MSRELETGAFVPLALFLRPVSQPATDAQPISQPATEAQPMPAPIPPPIGERDEAICAARRFHAGISDALEAAIPELLQRIARQVLARELRLAESDVAAVVASELDAFAGEKVLCIRAHPSDLAALRGFELEQVGDDALQPGDIRLVLQSGTIDLSLPARLDAALAPWNV